MSTIKLVTDQANLANNPLSLSKHDHDALQWSVALFSPDDILEMRLIPPKHMIQEQRPRQFIWGRTRSLNDFFPWVKAGRLSGRLKQLNALNTNGVATSWGFWDEDRKEWRDIVTVTGARTNVYCAANPRKTFAGSKAEHIAKANTLFVDLEDVAIEDVNEQLARTGLPKPTVTVNSGHGVHLYWRIDQPMFDLGLWTLLQKRLIRLFDQADRAIHDAARLMRLPGFLNWNGKPASCALIEASPDRRYDLAELEAHLPPATEEGGPRLKTRSTIVRPEPSEALNRALAYQDRFDPVGTGQRNSKVFDLACNLVERFDLSADDLLTVTDKYNTRLTEPIDAAELKEVTEKAEKHVRRKKANCGTAFINKSLLNSCDAPESDVISLDVWRMEMKKSRLESLQQPPAVYFDGSTTGAGKSTADLAAMRLAERSITLLPTHQACEEQAENLRREGLDAVAYPRLDHTTCLRFGNNKQPNDGWIAQSAGLDVGTALCASCPLFRKCEYQERRDQARKAKHVVATHSRAANSNFAIVKDREAVFIHEDCRDLLRPTFRVAAKRLPNTPHIRHLRDIQDIAEEAITIAERMGDKEKIAYAGLLYRSTKWLVLELKSDDLLADVEKADREEKLEQAVRVRELTLNEPRPRPDRLDLLLYQAVRATGIDPNGEVLRLCLAFASGELDSLCVVIDDTFTKGEKHHRQFYKSLVGVRRVDLPADSIVWLEDATADAGMLSNLARRPVLDRTPGGRLEQVVQPVQYPFTDVTLQTSGNIVRGLVRGLLARQLDKKQVGIITHRVHLPALKELEPFWQDRSVRLDYFRSGNDRASNRWLECDLLLILGTPRVPPCAVRQGLVQLGLLEDAGMDGKWKRFVWEGITLDGKSIPVEASGYHAPSWQRVHHILVRSLLLQAIGRGRGVLEKGIPVIVVTNEPLGLPFMAEELTPIKDSVGKTFLAVTELTDNSPTYITVGKMSVTTGEVASASGCSQKQARRHLDILSSSGLLCREGARGRRVLNAALSV